MWKCSLVLAFSLYFRGEDNALLVWSEERGLNNPQIFPFPKLTHGSGYLLPILTQSVSSRKSRSFFSAIFSLLSICSTFYSSSLDLALIFLYI